MKLRNFIMFTLLLKFCVLHSQTNVMLSIGTADDYASGSSHELLADFNFDFADKWQAKFSTGFIFRERGNLFRGINSLISRSFTVNARPVKLGVFHMWKPFSERMGEHNTGIIATLVRKNFDFDFGFHQRFFYIRQSFLNNGKYYQRYQTEKLNFMYRIMYKLIKKEDFRMKIGFGSFDSFTIQQETNPMLLAETVYKLSDRMSLQLNAAYLQAGLMNIRVNYYGYKIRGGVIWNLN